MSLSEQALTTAVNETSRFARLKPRKPRRFAYIVVRVRGKKWDGTEAVPPIRINEFGLN